MPRWMMPGKRLLWKWFMMGPSLSEPEAGLLCECPDSAVVAAQQLTEQPSVPCPNPDCKQLNAKENVTCAFCDEPLQVRLREGRSRRGAMSFEELRVRVPCVQMLEPVASTVAEAGGATALGSPTAKRGMEEVVSCPACTFLNPSTALICAMCNEPVPSAMGGEQKRSRVSGGDDADLELLGSVAWLR